MTCIVGATYGGVVYIGGDSVGVDTSDLAVTIRSDEKVFINGPCIFGCCGSFRMNQILRYQLRVPQKPAKMPTVRYVNTLLIEAIRATLKQHGCSHVEDNEEEVPGEFLLGFAGSLYAVEADYQVGTSYVPYMACGCGAAYALGAMYTQYAKLGARLRLRRALEAAEYFSGAVRRPFTILKLGA